MAVDQESAENRAAMAVVARERESQAAEAECRPTAVASAQQENRGTAVEGPMVAPVEVTDGQQKETLGTAVGGVQQSGGLLPPLSTSRTVEIEEDWRSSQLRGQSGSGSTLRGGRT